MTERTGSSDVISEFAHPTGSPGVPRPATPAPGADDRANLDKLLAALAGVPPQRRTARFRCAAMLVDPERAGVRGAEGAKR